MRFTKKGLSPLIAAVLLIVVVVGIGAVVTGIVRNYVTDNKQTITEKASDMKCGVEVDLTVPVVNEVLKMCHNSTANYIKFTIENTGTAVVDDLQVKFFGASGFETNDTVGTNTPSFGSDGMAIGETLEFNMTYTAGTVGTLQQINIVPRVKVTGRSTKAYCTDSSLTFTDFETSNCAP